MSAIPRSGYEMTAHANDQRRHRKIPLEAINECIERGEIVHRDDDERGEIVALRARWAAVHYEAVVNPEERKVITAEFAGDFK
jgi:hypothetical protein